MTVSELIAILEDVENKDLPILMAVDSKGEFHNALTEVSLGSFNEPKPDVFEVGIYELTTEKKAEGFSKNDVLRNKCLLFWPK